MKPELSEVQINAVVVFDATFNHPALRDITVGKEYQVVAMTDDDEPSPIIVDDSGEQNARSLQICDFRLVSTAEAKVAVYVEEPERSELPKHHYIASFAIIGKAVGDVGNVTMTVEGEVKPASLLYDL